MSRLLFNLHQVPTAEADAVKQLLDEHGVAYYESSPGFWGTGVHGLWLVEGAVIEAAKNATALTNDEVEQGAAAEGELSEYDDDQRFNHAKALIESFQRQYTAKAQAEFQQALAHGANVSLWKRVVTHPFRALAVTLIVGGLIALLLSPLWLFSAL